MSTMAEFVHDVVLRVTQELSPDMMRALVERVSRFPDDPAEILTEVVPTHGVTIIMFKDGSSIVMRHEDHQTTWVGSMQELAHTLLEIRGSFPGKGIKDAIQSLFNATTEHLKSHEEEDHGPKCPAKEVYEILMAG